MPSWSVFTFSSRMPRGMPSIFRSMSVRSRTLSSHCGMDPPGMRSACSRIVSPFTMVDAGAGGEAEAQQIPGDLDLVVPRRVVATVTPRARGPRRSA